MCIRDRLMMVSSVYQQGAVENSTGAKIDPNNQLLWRMNRRRLDFESMRDTFLALSGRIDSSIGGRPVDITTEPFTGRRTVYGFVERQNLPALFRTFDFASPDTTAPKRFLTTVPQQALFMINSPFVVEQARRLVDRLDNPCTQADMDRIRELYHITLQRDPDQGEVSAIRRFL